MAPRKPKPAEPVTAAGARRELIKLLRSVSDAGHQLWRVWSDFVEMSALALSNRVDRRQRDAREARYLQIVGAYKPAQVARFPEAFAALAASLEEEPFDVLGSVFMELELGNRWKGQFFTPFSLCRLIAALHVDDAMRATIAERGFVTANDPAVGAGAMPIALAVTMREAGIEPAEHLHVVAQDIDVTAVHMAYVQLALLGVPAVVVLGNSLAVEEREHWFTPAHVLGGWSWRLRGQMPPGQLIAAIAAAAARGEPANQIEAADVAEAATPPPPGQLALPLGDPAAAPRTRRRRAA